jgi:hypothetical protein
MTMYPVYPFGPPGKTGQKRTFLKGFSYEYLKVLKETE